MPTVCAEYDRLGTLQIIESTWNEVVGKYVSPHEAWLGNSGCPHSVYIHP